MFKSRRLVTLLGGIATAAMAGFFGAALAQADAIVHAVTGGPFETCDSGVCLVMGPMAENTWQYGGFRPFLTDWATNDQPYHVMVPQDDGSSVDAGSYAMKVQDFWSPFMSVDQYHYGDFTPTAAGAGADLGAFADMSGASIYDSTTLNGLVHNVIYDNVQVHGHEMSYYVTTMGDFTNVLVVGPGGSGDYIQVGDQDPSWVINSLDHTFLPVAPEYLIPNDPFAGIDFDPSDFLAGGIASL